LAALFGTAAFRSGKGIAVAIISRHLAITVLADHKYQEDMKQITSLKQMKGVEDFERLKLCKVNGA